MRDRWQIILLLAVLLGSVGVGAGIARHPTYEAQAELSVGQASLAAQSTPGYAQAVQNLSSIYSRLADSERVLNDTARDLDVPPSSLRGDVDANPVPASSVFRITTEASSAKQAIRVNRAATKAALDYIDTLSNNGEAEAAKAFSRYITATRNAIARRRRARSLRAKGNSEKITRLQTQAAGDGLVAEASAQVYRDNRTPGTQQFKGAVVLNRATTATDDRSSWTQRLVLLGVGAGLLIGVAFALLLGPRHRDRAASR